MKTISNETMQKYLNNKDYYLIIQSACQPFRKYMTKEELHSCQIVGLFHAIRKHNGKTKFTSYLYNCVKWECLTHLKKHMTLEHSLIDTNIEAPSTEIPFSELIAGLSEIEQDVVTQYFVEQKTFKEIGDNIGKSHETARKHYNRAMDRLKRHFTVFPYK